MRWKTNMKIIHFIPDDSIGGLQNFCLSLAKAQNFDHNVAVYYFKRNRKLALTQNIAQQFSLIKYLSILFARKEIMLHTHGNVLSLIGTLCLFNSNVKIVHTVHNEAKYEAGSKRMKLHSFWFKCKFAYPVVIAESLQADFKDYYGFDAFAYVLNGIADDKIYINYKKKSNATFNLLFLGRLDYQKNINLLLKAVNKINNKTLLPIRLHVAGRDEQVYDQELFDELQHQNIVLYYGLVEKPAFLFDICDCICFSSIFEGLPIAAIEAKLSKLQLLTTDVGGISDIIEPWDILLPNGSGSDTFADGIIAAHSKKELVEETNIDFSISRVKKEYDRIYDKIMYITNN